MMARYFGASWVSLIALLSASRAVAGMGPCQPAADFGLICGSGDGAARAIVKTISPSKRLAFAWRLTGRPPITPPEKDNADLENMIIRLSDGSVIAASPGAYWDLSTKIAKAYLMTAWSPDSHLLVKVEQRAESVSAELFAFAEDDAATGPFDLTEVIASALREKISAPADKNYVLVFSARPQMTVDDQGVLRAVVNMRGEDSNDSERYDITVQLTQSANSLGAKIMSVTPRAGTSISIIVH
jgi:hypothetical protein